MGNGIWDPYADWDEVGGHPDRAVIRARITGMGERFWRPNRAGPEFLAAMRELRVDIARRLRHRGTVLDFGCGLGRNLPFLKNSFARVVGIDLPSMIESLRQGPEAAGYDALYDDRARLVAEEAVDVCYDSVVWQHIVDPAYCEAILADLLRIGRLRHVITISNIYIGSAEGQGGWALTARLLHARGWREVHSSTDARSFGVPHVVRILQRPD